MSSPLAHAAVGYAIYHAFRRALPTEKVIGVPARVAWPIAAVGLSVLPDVDAAVGWTFGSLERYHNNLSHSLLACLVASVVLAFPVRWLGRATWKTSFGFLLSIGLTHLLVDLVTRGRGLMLFWPLSPQRFHAPFALFCGVPWSSPLTSPGYLQMIAEDACFAAAVLLAVALARLIAVRRAGES